MDRVMKKSIALLFYSLCCILSLGTKAFELPLHQVWWSYSSGGEFPGATGMLSWPQERTLRLDGNFHNGGDYVMAFLGGQLALPAAEKIRFDLRTNGNATTFRIQDGAGKMHQYQIPVKNTTQWQTVELPLVYSACSWGGPDNKSFSPGVKYLGCLVRKQTSTVQGSSFLEVRRIDVLTKNPAATDNAFYCLPPVLDPETLLIVPGGTLTIPLIGPDGVIAYTLQDYSGKTVKEGTLNCQSSKVRLEVPKSEGYFDLHIAGGTISFITASPLNFKADPFWGMDESFSWWGTGGDFRRGYMRFLIRSGISWGRDRLRWGELHPERNKMNLTTGDYQKILDWSKQEGLHVLNVFHDSPDWNKRLLKEEDNFMVSATSQTGYSYGSNVYPRDYPATSKSWREICRNFPAIEAMEVWNEPDIGFGNDFPAEFFIALTKNFSATFRMAGLNTKVIGGVLAIPQETTPYYRNLIAGGLLDDCDAFSFHTYRNPQDLEQQMFLLRKQEREAGRIPGFPFWITESGRPWPSGPARPDVSQGKFSAQEITGKAIESRALGIQKYFPFFVIWHVETIFNFSMFDQRHTPLRSMGAYVAATRLFSHKNYNGDIKLPGSDLCRVFSDGKTAVVWVYKSFAWKIAGDWGSLDKDAHTKVHISLPSGMRVDKILGADGRELQLNNGELPMDDGLCYLVLRAENIGRHLITNTRAMTLYRMAMNYQPKERQAKSIVIQPDYDPSLYKYNRDGIFLKNNQDFDLSVIFNNLSSEPVTVRPILKKVPSCLIADVTDLPEVKLLPESMQRFHFKVKGTSRLPERDVVLLEVADQYGNATPMTVGIGGMREIPPLNVGPLSKMGKAAFTKLEGKEAWNSFSGQWTGQIEPDISAVFRLGYDKSTLCLEVQINDKSHSCAFVPAMAWLGDSVQAAFAVDSRQIEICASHGLEGDRVYRHIGVPEGLTDKIKFEWTRDDKKKTTHYKLFIPAQELGINEFTPGMDIRCTLLLNSGGTDGRHGFLTWGDGIRGSKKVSEFNKLILQ